MDRRFYFYFVSLSGLILVLLTGCEAAQNIAPEIREIVAPQDENTTSGSADVSSTAVVDPKNWGYSKVYFSVAPNAADLFNNAVAEVADASCTSQSSDSSVLDCTAEITVDVGTWHFQWHLDYGQTGADTATLSRPDPASDTFTVRAVASGGGPDPDVTVVNSPDVNEDEALVLFDPEDDAQCVGQFFGADIDTGETFLTLNWRAESTDEYQTIPGNFQFMLEHTEEPNCADKDQLGLDLSDPDAAWAYDDEGGCYVVPTNHNSASTPGLQPHHTYRARVRRIKSDDTFGEWTDYVSFQTASPPATEPVFESPTPGGTVDMPDTVTAQSVEFLWRLQDCPPTGYNIAIFENDSDQPNITGSGGCGWNGDPFLCHHTAVLNRGASFRAEVTSSTQYGSIQSSMSFSTD